MVPWVLELQSLCNPTFLHELRGKHTPPPPTLANQGESHPLTWPSITSTTLQSSTARSGSVQWRLNFVTRTGVRTGKSQSTRRIQRGRKGSRTVELPHLSPRLLIELTLRGGAVAFVAESQRQPLRTLPQLLRARRSFVQERLCVTGAALLRLPSPPREGLPAQPTPLSQLLTPAPITPPPRARAPHPSAFLPQFKIMRTLQMVDRSDIDRADAPPAPQRRVRPAHHATPAAPATG